MDDKFFDDVELSNDDMFSLGDIFNQSIDDDLDMMFDFSDIDDTDFDSIKANLEDQEEVVDVVDRINKLDDRLSHSIILKNISDDLCKTVDPLTRPINYITKFKNKVMGLNPASSIFDKYEIESICKSMKDGVLTMIKSKFSVSIGRDDDLYSAIEFLDDLEALYDFLVVSYSDNIINYMISMINKLGLQVMMKYKSDQRLKLAENDIFYRSLKNKLANKDTAIVLHFLEEIVLDIINSFDSGYDLFMNILNLDAFEEKNARMLKLLENYGNGIMFENDNAVYVKFFEPIRKKETFINFLSKLEMKIMENAELALPKTEKTKAKKDVDNGQAE